VQGIMAGRLRRSNALEITLCSVFYLCIVNAKKARRLLRNAHYDSAWQPI
jgi:hypothetical protein